MTQDPLHWSDATYEEHYNNPDFLIQLCFAGGLVWNDFQGWDYLSDVLHSAKPQSATDAPPSQSQMIFPLWRLRLRGYSGGCQLVTFPALSAFTDITHLSMEGCNTQFNALKCIFQVCPHLTHLHFDGDGLIHNVGTDVTSMVVKAGLAPVDHFSLVPQLQTMSMTKPNLFVNELLYLLGTQSSLKSLALKDLSMGTFPKHQIHHPDLYILTRGILGYLKQASDSIQSLYMPYSRHVDSIDYTLSWRKETFEDELVQVCKRVTNWKFMACTSGHFPALNSLTEHHNNVTTLDLECEDGSTLWLQQSSDLDNFLCQASKTLLHLRLPTMIGRPESMDVFYDRGSELDWFPRHGDMVSHRRRVWACRDLKTLSIGFSGAGRGNIKRSDYYHASLQSRLIFGYLARVCPKLEELVMVMNLNNLFLESGFCLLTRMKYLKRLEIKLAFCSWPFPVAERIEIDWINAHSVVRDAGIGAQWQKRHWNKELQPWDILHNKELEIVTGREIGQHGHGQGNVSVNDLEMEDMEVPKVEDWKHVGLFAESRSESDKLQREGQAGNHCWPMMESFRIMDKHSNAQQAEEVIKKLRPEINFISAPIQKPEPRILPAEVLERILCFLDHRSQKSARFVSKGWFTVSCRYIGYTLSNSKKSPTYSNFLERVSFASRLEWNMFTAWQPLCDALEYAKPRTAIQRPLPRSFLDLGPRTLIVPLRSLTVRGNPTNYHLLMFPQLDVFQNLVSLSLLYHTAAYTAIQQIFNPCPLLQHLQLEGQSFITWSASPTVKYPLANYVSDRSLQKLELMSLRVRPRDQDKIHITIRHSHEAGILTYLRQHGSSLEHLHVSFLSWSDDITDYGPSSQSFGTDLIEICPHVLGWGALLECNGYCRMLQSLASHHDMLTTLDLRTPQLLHLRLPSMCDLPESMNVYRDMDDKMQFIGSAGGAVRGSRVRRHPVWACRRLKTLTVGFADDFYQSEIHSKCWRYGCLVFEYLSRVCPDMEELTINTDLNNLYLETGICLLTRMRRHRKLDVRLGNDACELVSSIELNWIKATSAGRDAGVAVQWQARYKTFDRLPWNTWEKKEAEIIVSRGGGKKVIEELRLDAPWEYMGMLADIGCLSCELQMEAWEGRHCWPRMESLRIRNASRDAKQRIDWSGSFALILRTWSIRKHSR
ncbi:hypothetical protein BGZ93_008348 [Podila epicladia]|nr:hypothetical protein BGZ93_008348 [Podila epicladia]